MIGKIFFLFFLCICSTNSQNSWSNLVPASPIPPIRWLASLVYTGSKNMILFGGANDVSPYNDLWEYSISSNSWTQLTPSGNPPSARWSHVAVYTLANNMLVFGGYSPSIGYLNDLWEYSVSSNSWIQLNPSGNIPIGRSGCSIIYTNSNTFIIFGGFNFSSFFNDLWQYDISNNSWTLLNPSGNLPVARNGHNAVYTKSNNMFMFGGTIQNASGAIYLNDLWQYDISNNFWTQLTPSGSLPPPRAWHSYVYNANTMLIFGGEANYGAYLNDLWEYSVSSNSWIQLNPSGNLPTGRMGQSAIYTNTNSMIVFGGGLRNTGVCMNDLWKYSFICHRLFFQFYLVGFIIIIICASFFVICFGCFGDPPLLHPFCCKENSEIDYNFKKCCPDCFYWEKDCYKCCTKDKDTYHDSISSSIVDANHIWKRAFNIFLGILSFLVIALYFDEYYSRIQEDEAVENWFYIFQVICFFLLPFIGIFPGGKAFLFPKSNQNIVVQSIELDDKSNQNEKENKDGKEKNPGDSSNSGALNNTPDTQTKSNQNEKEENKENFFNLDTKSNEEKKRWIINLAHTIFAAAVIVILDAINIWYLIKVNLPRDSLFYVFVVLSIFFIVLYFSFSLGIDYFKCYKNEGWKNHTWIFRFCYIFEAIGFLFCIIAAMIGSLDRNDNYDRVSCM